MSPRTSLNYHKSARGFSLIEILVAIGIISILLSVVLVAVNPRRAFVLSNNRVRFSHSKAIKDAVNQYTVDSKSLPVALSAVPVCNDNYGAIGDFLELGTDIGKLDLTSNLIPTYLAKIPLDPRTGTVGSVGYQLCRYPNNTVCVLAVAAESTDGDAASMGCDNTVVSLVPRYLSQFGSFGSGNGQFNYPAGVLIDQSENIFIADTYNNRIQKFDASGAYVSQFGSGGTGNGQFDQPWDGAVDSAGNIYIVDGGNNRVQKFTSAGIFILTWGTSGSGNGQFNTPGGIDIDSSDTIYVTDVYNHRVQKFNTSGTYLSQFGSNGTGNGQFDRPWDLGVDRDGNIYVTDYNNNRIQKFSPSGTYITKWGTLGTGDGQFDHPYTVSVQDTQVYVGDTGNHRIQKFSTTGKFVAKWGSMGTGDGQFDTPEDIYFYGDRYVYIVDTNNNRIQKFEYVIYASE